VFVIPFILGIFIGVLAQGGNLREILLWGCRLVQLIGAFGLALSAISFTKQSLMRPLNYQKEWETYFHKFNLAFVIFFISLFISVYSYTVEAIIKAYL
jgi:Na+/H+ antiporter NhaD/arsenite permease-like protein